MIVNKIQTEIETHKFYGKGCEMLSLHYEHVATNYLIILICIFVYILLVNQLQDQCILNA